MLRLLRPHWAAVLIGVLGLLGVDILQVLVPRIMQHVIDALGRGAATTRLLLLAGAGIAGVALGMGVCRFVWRYFLIGASHRIERDLRGRFYQHLQTLSIAYFDHQKVGDLMAHATNDTYAVRRALGFATLAAIDAVVMAVIVLVMMLSMSPRLTLITLTPLPLLAFIIAKFGAIIHARYDRVQASFSRMSERATETFSGVRVVKAYGADAVEYDCFHGTSQTYVRENLDLARVWAWFDPLIAALATCSIALLIYFGGRAVIRTDITLGQFVAFASYLGMFAWPMIAVGIVVNMMQRGAASMQRLLTILQTPAAIVSGAQDAAVQPRLECRALSFRYAGVATDVLHDLSFALPPGQVLGIVGRTGAGKTTLIELLMRLYEPPPAAIFIDGHDLRTLQLERVRGLFGYVAQEPFLFSMSVADNIRFGRPDLARAAVIELATAVRLHEEIEAFPQGYDTLVGERGITLSGGQKQRIAIARALALRPAVLVLDDALSSVDAETEDAILAYLRAPGQRTTMIIIAHRISAVRDADMILVLDDGRIVDRGTHAALVQREGFYSELYRLQTLEAMHGTAPTPPA